MNHALAKKNRNLVYHACTARIQNSSKYAQEQSKILYSSSIYSKEYNSTLFILINSEA